MEVTGDYIGDELPKWVKEGICVRVKHTRNTRQFGLKIISGPDRTWPGEIGVITKQQGNGWWCYRIEFPRGLNYTVRNELLEDLIRVKPTLV